MKQIQNNMKRILPLIIGCFISYGTMAQTNRDVSGVVKDSTGTSIIAATVKFIAGKDTIFTRTDIDGKFAFKSIKSSTFLITVSSLGYQALNKRFLYKMEQAL